MSEFGNLLRNARQRAGMTQGDVARSLCVSVTYISDVERGERPPLVRGRIDAVAALLGCDAAELKIAAGGDLAEITMLRETLRRLGRHDERCRQQPSCTCGLSKALAEPKSDDGPTAAEFLAVIEDARAELKRQGVTVDFAAWEAEERGE
jgi:transcriptional regulator with XRE-family HTH domain